MASAAQIIANRLNAQKSTGPRTPEGKAVVSQNAVKHGLLARQVVIRDEDPDEFDSFRDGMLEELAPEGSVEALLAERLIGLSWRLRRAERLQGTVFDAVYRENAEGPVWPPRELRVQPQPEDSELILGQVLLTDFAHAKVLDRLLVYERRIENSLYRTMAELRKHQKLRETDTPTREPPRRGETSFALGSEEEEPCASEEVGREPALSLPKGRPTLDPVEGRLYEEASDDATTNATSQEPPEGGTPNASADDLSCETNPIPWSDGRAEQSSPSLPDADQALRSSLTRADCAVASPAGFC